MSVTKEHSIELISPANNKALSHDNIAMSDDKVKGLFKQ